MVTPSPSALVSQRKPMLTFQSRLAAQSRKLATIMLGGLLVALIVTGPTSAATKKAKRTTTRKPATTKAAAPTTKAVAATVPAVTAAPTASAAERPPAGLCVAANASQKKPEGKQRLVIATGGTGGVFFPYGGGLARVLSSKMANTEATGQVTGGSVDNNKLLHKGEVDLGMTTADSGADAIAGEGVYTELGKAKICTIAVLYDSYVHVVAAAESGVQRVEDLKGKRISVGSPGSSTEVAANRVLEAAGLKLSDVTRDFLSVAESVNAIKDRKIAAFFWIGGLPTAAVTDLTTSGPPVKFIETASLLPALKAKYGSVYYPKTLKSGVYKGVSTEVPGLGVDNLLLANAAMSESLVFEILDTLFINQADVQAVHPEARTFNINTAAAISPVPFHPGAIAFYRFKGVYKP